MNGIAPNLVRSLRDKEMPAVGSARCCDLIPGVEVSRCIPFLPQSDPLGICRVWRVMQRACPPLLKTPASFCTLEGFWSSAALTSAWPTWRRALCFSGPRSPRQGPPHPPPLPPFTCADRGGDEYSFWFRQVCGTDVHLKHGRLNTVPDPIIPGHVSVGTVFAVSGHVVDVEGREVHFCTSASAHLLIAPGCGG